MSVGDIAVDMFFFASGLLVTGSLLARGAIAEFLGARALRVFPGLIVAVTLTVCVLGLCFTSLSVGDYFRDSGTLRYWLKNVTLVTGVQHRLPGVFLSNPWPWSVNSSLWTLPYEISMYGLLAFLGLVLRINVPRFAARLLWVGLAIAIASLFATIVLGFVGRPSSLIRLSGMFWAGVCLYLLRDKVPVSSRIGCIAGLVIAIAASDKRIFLVAYTLLFPYLILCLAYLPGGFVRRYNRIGDYSYGIYIYAFPVQQAVAAVARGVSVSGLFAASGLVTVLLASASWHLIESPMLNLKRRK